MIRHESLLPYPHLYEKAKRVWEHPLNPIPKPWKAPGRRLKYGSERRRMRMLCCGRRSACQRAGVGIDFGGSTSAFLDTFLGPWWWLTLVRLPSCQGVILKLMR